MLETSDCDLISVRLEQRDEALEFERTIAGQRKQMKERSEQLMMQLDQLKQNLPVVFSAISAERPEDSQITGLD